MSKDDIKHISFMDAFFFATTPRSMLRSAEKIAVAEKAKLKKLEDKRSKANQADDKKPVAKAERKRAERKTLERIPRPVSLCTPCALFMPVHVSEIISPRRSCGFVASWKADTVTWANLSNCIFPIQLASLPPPPLLHILYHAASRYIQLRVQQ